MVLHILNLPLDECFLLLIRKLLAHLGAGLVLCNPINFTNFCSGLKLKQQIKTLTTLTRKKNYMHGCYLSGLVERILGCFNYLLGTLSSLYLGK